MKSHRTALLAGLLVLFLSILACTINLGGPKYPTERIPVSTEALGDLEGSLGTAQAASTITGELTLTITEAQVTSYLASRLQEQPDNIITDPQVFLRDGQAQFYGTVRQGNFLITVSAIFTAGIDEQGQLKITLKSADFGPIAVPDNVTELITSSIQEAFVGAVGPVATGIRLESVTITDGSMTVVGRTK